MTGELIATEPPELEAMVSALEGEFAVRMGAPVTIDRIYLDTFDGRLRAAGLTLYFQQGRVELIGDDDGTPALATVSPEPGRRLMIDDLHPGALRDAVGELIEMRALIALARVEIGSVTLAVVDELEKTVARLTVDSPSLVSASGRSLPLRARLRLTGVRGYDAELRLARRLVKRALAVSAAKETLFEEAIVAAGGSPGGVSAKIDVALEAGERSDEAAARVLMRLSEVIDANLPGTVADTDSEFLHDYRVAVRRTRSVQRELAGIFPPAALTALRGEFKWLQQVTGDARDLDVYVLGFDAMRDLLPESMRADLWPLLTVLQRRRLVARRHMVRELRSDRAKVLRDDWVTLLAGLRDLPEDDRPMAGRGIADLSGERIRKVYGRMVTMGRAIDAGSPPEAYHDLRKKGKELRYLLELFGTQVHDPAVVKPMIKTLKAVQDVLGHHQDREVQMTMLRSLRGEVSAMPGGAGALMVMGVLIERLEEDAQSARGEFAGVFGPFASASQQKLVKKAFA